MAFDQVVINRDLVPRVEQFLDANRSNVTRSACDKNFHGGEATALRRAAQWENSNDRGWNPSKQIFWRLRSLFPAISK